MCPCYKCVHADNFTVNVKFSDIYQRPSFALQCGEQMERSQNREISSAPADLHTLKEILSEEKGKEKLSVCVKVLLFSEPLST